MEWSAGQHACVAFRPAKYLEVVARLTEGDFPKYDQLIPRDSDANARIVVPVDALLSEVNAASVCAREASDIIRFVAEDGRLMISAEAAEVASYSAELAAETVGQTKIALNAHHVQEALAAWKGNTAVLDTSNPRNPLKLHFLEDGSYVEVMMPMFIEKYDNSEHLGSQSA